jgi:hypothetical protein
MPKVSLHVYIMKLNIGITKTDKYGYHEGCRLSVFSPARYIKRHNVPISKDEYHATEQYTSRKRYTIPLKHLIMHGNNGRSMFIQ